MGNSAPKYNFENVYKYPLEITIKKRLAQEPDPLWWEKMVAETKKERSQKVGKLR